MEQLKVKNDPTKLQQLLGSKLYSDKYSFISEALQNSTDAMRKIGKQDENFDLGIKQVDYEFYFYIRDYGYSFDSIDEFNRLVGTLLESSKTQSKDSTDNQELGKYGIGSIAFSAYHKSCNYTVYKNI
jgi:HSP90 family molecular chaperone